MDDMGMIIPMPDGSSHVFHDPKILSQQSFGVDPLEYWPFHMYKAEIVYQLFLTTPSHGSIEALELAGVHIMHEKRIDTYRHYIVVDGANYEKLGAYLESRKQREEGVCSNT
jgi:hypothetical protein